MVADFPARGVGDPPGLNPREQILHIAVDHVNTAPPLSGEGLRDERVDERQPRNIFVGAENDVRRAVVAGLEIVINRRVRQARSEEHTSELQSLMRISYAVFCLHKKTVHNPVKTYTTPP